MKSLALAALLLAPSCAVAFPGGHTTGLIQNVRSGGSPVSVEGAPLTLEGLTTGEAEEISLLGLISIGDSSMMAAAKNGGLTSVRYVDRAVFSFLGIFAKYTTRVAGK